ncbi:hypothetical protein KMW28_13855 [Flammeovirga yaeyamensis]|uniref:Uncharacterized protein n=1 Tax=Flammeovirga yaeyamensis TaxID=367791 RepID=A0AAX1MZS3_9BACT|nr:hypothetical protein [Flammeovirga yaeyamensis]MBB3700331.1 hypothetical protein [Flammeovirga yaeyamensis]NMF37043.1 hypothetical protein [Flammeovirga yaeyamensis]QWG00735.1 hypothetical protein KMW28_13855 [Flammeovirga yaeyamensis]
MKKFLLIAIPAALLVLDYMIIQSVVHADNTSSQILAAAALIIMVTATISSYPLIKHAE